MRKLVQGKEVAGPVVHPSSLASDLASASEAAFVDIPGAASAGSFVVASAGGPGVAFVDTSEAVHAGIPEATGGH